MKCFGTILIIFGSVLAISCQQSNTFSSEDKKAVGDAVRQILHDYYDDIRESGLKAEFNYLDDSEDFFWTPPGYSSAISYDSVAAVINQNAILFPSVDNSWETLQVTPLSKELAAYTGRLHSVATDSSGQVFETKLVETGLLIKRQDGWKLLGGQTTALSE